MNPNREDRERKRQTSKKQARQIGILILLYGIVKRGKTLYTTNDVSLFTGENADRKTYVGDRFSAQGAALEQALPFPLRYD